VTCCTNKGIVLRTFFCTIAATALLIAAAAVAVRAEPIILIYPNSPTVFRYDPARYQELLPGDPNFDAAGAISGTMLWDKIENRLPIEVYRAPGLYGFEPSLTSRSEYVVTSNRFDLIIDGFHEAPRYLSNLYIRFIPDPPHSSIDVVLDGVPLDRLIHPLPGFRVTTPIGGGYYSDTQQVRIFWSSAVAMRVSVYSDKNGNRVYDDGIPRFGLYVLDNCIPVKSETWGSIKALYNPD
jgi:hypothetical protein